MKRARSCLQQEGKGEGEADPWQQGQGQRDSAQRRKVSRGHRGLDTEEKKGETEIKEKRAVGRTSTNSRAFPLGPVWTSVEAPHPHGHIHRMSSISSQECFRNGKLPARTDWVRCTRLQATYLKLGHTHQP